MENTEASAEAGLHEFVDIEFMIPALDTPAKEKSLSDALKDLPSVRNLSIAKARLRFNSRQSPCLKTTFSRRSLALAFRLIRANRRRLPLSLMHSWKRNEKILLQAMQKENLRGVLFRR